MKGPPSRVAVFISPHGFGHAARASAVMEALHRRTGAHFEVFTTAPDRFFDQTVPGCYHRHHEVTDVGFVQRSALSHDGAATVAALRAFVPFREARLEPLADLVSRTGCDAVLCDISPMGVAVAARAGVPSVLVENFTWPWLYAELEEGLPEIRPMARELGTWFDRADVHVKAEPYCDPSSRADLVVPPVCRAPRRSREETRESLGLPGRSPLVVLTMGGLPEALPFLERLRRMSEVRFLVTGAPATGVEGNLHLIDADADLYMPDVLHACDAVVAKLGYSVVAECWRSCRPLAYVTRPGFRETGPLQAWVQEHLAGFEIPAAEFPGADWSGRMPELLDAAPRPCPEEGGAELLAEYLAKELL